MNPEYNDYFEAQTATEDYAHHMTQDPQPTGHYCSKCKINWASLDERNYTGQDESCACWLCGSDMDLEPGYGDVYMYGANGTISNLRTGEQLQQHIPPPPGNVRKDPITIGRHTFTWEEQVEFERRYQETINSKI